MERAARNTWRLVPCMIFAWKNQICYYVGASNVKGLYYYKYNFQFSLEIKKNKTLLQVASVS
jgi:hypothetical protein